MSELERLLYSSGLPESKAEVLRRYGIYSPEALTLLSPEELSKILDISQLQAMMLIKKARERSLLKVLDISDYLSRIVEAPCFTTGCKALDSLLGGGIFLRRIIEFTGESGTGKTQLAHQLCITIQLPESRQGLDLGAIYIDSEGSFRPERLVRIAQRFKLDPRKALHRILHARVTSFAQQYSAIVKARELISEGYGLMVVDTVTSLLQREYSRDIARRQWALARLLQELRFIALENVAVVLSNVVISDPATGKVKPAGGYMLEQFVDTRVLLYRRDKVRIAEVIYSVETRMGRAKFKITSEGIEDFEN